MTSISLTSGQIYEIVNLLCEKGEKAESDDDLILANYYCKMAEQFADVSTKLCDLPSEDRVANLILAMN